MASIEVSDRIIIVRLSFNDCSVACDRFRGHRNQVYPQAENNGSLSTLFYPTGLPQSNHPRGYGC